VNSVIMSIVKQCILILFLVTTGLMAQEKVPSEGPIPALAWGGIPNHLASVERYKEMRESGITLSLVRPTSPDSMELLLNMAKKAGVKLFVRCPELKTEPEQIVRRFKKHPAVAGYFLRDEPPRSEFEELGTWVRRIQAVDAKNLCYINLLPNFALPKQLGTSTYQEYITDFYRMVPTQVVSFDNYPVLQTPKGKVLRKDWYENLEIVAAEARRLKKPLWTFALTTAHGDYPIPTRGELRVQVYSGLAYGAQAMQYFTYWTPLNRSQYVYHHGPITEITHQRTEVYDRMKALNQEIQQLSGVFLGSKVVSTGHTGNNIPKGTTRLVIPNGLKVLEVDGEALVSVMEKGRYRYVLIVNTNFQQPMQLKLEGESSLMKVQKDGTLVEASRYISTQAVDAGDIAIYRMPIL
jgi:hypothetical protein